ncbi:hypothetical protein [Thalassospira sp.]|uniref:hypothetical protein n=1 Tax=Thalassospira sp. TaxID=1912094 RepID=UPI00257B4418|nr:hypothetical protein [Thalassospira sp.]
MFAFGDGNEDLQLFKRHHGVGIFRYVLAFFPPMPGDFKRGAESGAAQWTVRDGGAA